MLGQRLIHRFNLADELELSTYLEHHNSLHELRKALSLSQHHDGVSGTEKQHVAIDYGKRLSDGMNAVKKVAAHLMTPFNEAHFDYQFCTLTNTTYIDCPTKEMLAGNHRAFLVKIYNPSAARR